MQHILTGSGEDYSDKRTTNLYTHVVYDDIVKTIDCL